MRRLSLPLCLLIGLGACNSVDTSVPSLAPRAAEAIDPRLPVRAEAPIGAADSALSARLSGLLAQAQAGDIAFAGAAATAERLAAMAGSPQSESWIVAQQALSFAIAQREPTARALGDVDGIAARAIAAQGGMAPADLQAIDRTAAAIAAIDRAQTQKIAAIRARLAG